MAPDLGMKKTCLVVPCYNESERLDTEAFLGELKLNPNLSLIFVNDGSTDGTHQVLKNLFQQCPTEIHDRIHVIHYKQNQGKATAVQRGLLWAHSISLKLPGDRKSTRLNSSHIPLSRMPSSA